MGRHRLPTDILEQRGAFKHDPRRAEDRAGEPKPEAGIGDPPAYFDATKKAAWKEIVTKCHDGVLSDADAIAVEVASILLAEMRADPGSFAISKIARLNSLLSQFGMTPADRSRVKVRSPEKKNRFTEMRNRVRPPLAIVPKAE